MAEQTWNISALPAGALIGNPRSIFEVGPDEISNEQVIASLSGANYAIYPTNLQYFTGGFGTTLSLDLSSTPTGNSQVSDEMSPTFERQGVITITIGGHELRLTIGTDTNRDTGEPYSWTLTAAARTRGNTWLRQISQGDTGTLTLSDGVAGEITGKPAGDSITEAETNTFTQSGVAGTVTWRVKSGGGTITDAGVYTPANVSADTQVTIAVRSDGTEVDTYTFTVTPVFSGTISNKPDSVASGGTHDFNATVSAGDTPAWSVKSPSSGGGTINSSGVYTAPTVTSDRDVVVALSVGGVEQDTASFTVTAFPTIANKIQSLAEGQTHDFNIDNASNAAGVLSWRVKSGGGAITGAGVYSTPNVSADTTVVVALIDTADGTAKELDTDTFTVTPVFTGAISNPLTTLEVGQTHQFATTGVSDPTLVTWRVNSGGGSIVANGTYTPPNVIITTAVEIGLLVGGLEVATDSFDVTPLPVSSTQYAYIRSATAPTLPTPNDQRNSENIPSGWGANALTSTTTLAVYRISRTITEFEGAFQRAESNWAWDPSSQPSAPWRDLRLSTATQNLYRHATSAPTLPTTSVQALPPGWSETDPGASGDAHTYRIRRTVSSRAGNFVSATPWRWNPSRQPGTPWRQATSVTSTQNAFRRSEDQPTLPASRTEALPTGWMAVAQATTATEGVWRIARTVTMSLGAFVSATAWEWSPAVASQPLFPPYEAKFAREVTKVRDKATGLIANIIWAISSDVRDGEDGDDGSSEEHVFAATATAGALTAAQSPEDSWVFDAPGQATAGYVTRGGVRWYDGIAGNVSETLPWIREFRRTYKGSEPAAGEHPTRVAYDTVPGDGEFAAKGWVEQAPVRAFGADGNDGNDGQDGEDGNDGRDGTDGTNGLDGDPGVRGLAGYAESLTRSSRETSSGGVNGQSEWFLSGGTAAWTGNRTLTIGVSAANEEALERIAVGGLATVYDDTSNWADYTFRSAVTFSGTGTSRRATISLAYVEGVGVPPSTGAIEFHYTLSGKAGVDGKPSFPGFGATLAMALRAPTKAAVDTRQEWWAGVNANTAPTNMEALRNVTRFALSHIQTRSGLSVSDRRVFLNDLDANLDRFTLFWGRNRWAEFVITGEASETSAYVEFNVDFLEGEWPDNNLPAASTRMTIVFSRSNYPLRVLPVRMYRGDEDSANPGANAMLNLATGAITGATTGWTTDRSSVTGTVYAIEATVYTRIETGTAPIAQSQWGTRYTFSESGTVDVGTLRTELISTDPFTTS